MKIHTLAIAGIFFIHSFAYADVTLEVSDDPEAELDGYAFTFSGGPNNSGHS